MKKLLLPALAFVTCFAACQRSGDSYLRIYHVYYYPVGDSFSATASFSIPNAGKQELTGKESVSFNDREADYTENNRFHWQGTGKPDAKFSFHRRKKTYESEIMASQISNYELIAPDTVYMSKGFTIRIKGYKKDESKNTYLNLSIPTRGIGVQMSGDSSNMYPDYFTNAPEGKWLLEFKEAVQINLPATEDGDSGQMTYWLSLQKEVYLVK